MLKSMATRTGDPALDALLDSFQQTWVGKRPGELRVSSLTDPALAEALCNTVSFQLAEHLRANGYDAECGSEEGTYSTPGQAGYTDRITLGIEQHDWTEVTAADGREYMVDFTAAQYGYTEFPMVQRLSNDGVTWERNFTIQPQLADLDAPQLHTIATPSAPDTDPEPHEQAL